MWFPWSDAYDITLSKLFSVFSNSYFSTENATFTRFFAAFNFLRTDFIDSGGVKKTKTEKYTFLRCDFYCPQKSMT